MWNHIFTFILITGIWLTPFSSLTFAQEEETKSLANNIEINSLDDVLQDNTSPTGDALAFAEIFKRGQAAFRSRDYSSAFKDWRSLAIQYDETKNIESVEQGARAYYVVLSQMLVALCYDKGHGVKTNKTKSLSFYIKAANFGIPFLQFFVANRYDDGIGIRQDYQEAFKWYHRAALGNVVDAQYFLGNRYTEGKGVEKDEREAIIWYRKAANRGHSPSQLALVSAYLLGKGASTKLR